MSDNPLAERRPRPAEPKDDPMQRHAMIWAHVSQQTPDDLQQHVQVMDYALPILGALAGNPKVNGKDVIKAVSGAVADGKISPSQGVATISQIPDDDEKIQPWLKQMYSDYLMTTVHAKAALMRQQAPQAAPMQPPNGGMPQ